MVVGTRQKAADLLNSVKFATDIPSKLKHLRLLKVVLLQMDPSLLPEIVPSLLELRSDCSSPIRKFLTELISEIGLKHVEFLPEIVLVLISFLKDDTPAVTRQAILSGTDLFCNTFKRVAIKGLFSKSEMNDSFDSAWTWILKFKDAVYPLAFQHGSDGIRLLAVKFVEAMVLLYLPDPNSPSNPPPLQSYDGDIVGFSISWIQGGHPMLSIGDLVMEANRSTGSLLDQLRPASVKSLSSSIIIVLINSLTAIAMKRPLLYGRILPVLLGLDPSWCIIKGLQVSGIHHALKKAFMTFLKCTHPGAAPWHDRLVDALKGLDAGELRAQTNCQVEKIGDGTPQGICQSHSTKDENLLIQASDSVQTDNGRKRSVIQENSDLVQVDDTSKRIKPEPVSEFETKSLFQTNPYLPEEKVPSPGLPSLSADGDTGPVQQLVAMFGALVAKGDKAAESLEILVSSISSDLLAEVVMANMRHLPPTCPKTEEEEEPVPGMGSVSCLTGSNAAVIQPSVVAGVLSLSSAFPQIASLLSAQSAVSSDAPKLPMKDEQQLGSISDTTIVCANVNDESKPTAGAGSPLPGISPVSPGNENAVPCYPLDTTDAVILESEIPGLHPPAGVDELQHTNDHNNSSNVDTQRLKQEPVTSSDSTVSLDFQQSGSISTCRSDEHSPRVTVTDSRQTTTSSVIFPSQYLLPKMSVPIVTLTDEQKDNIQKLVFVRIIEAYKEITLAGGSHFRFSLLAHLGVEYPLEMDSWGLLQKHIFADFSNHEGHELTLRVLYRLFREAEQDHDFLSATNATSAYDALLLTVAETLRDSFPASDKSLSKLLGEVPYLPKAVLKLLECLCSPGSNKTIDRESQSGDRVTQGLSAVWSLILLRPSNRDACLKIALQSAVHHLEEVRMKAIRLVANKLYPMSCIAQQIEDFAKEMLLSMVNSSHDFEGADVEGSTAATQKDTNLERSLTTTDNSSDTQQSSQNLSSSAFSEAQRCMSLYFALCTKKHSLLRQIFVIYKGIPKSVKQVVHRQIPILVRTIGSSPELFGIISDLPTGSESLLMQVLHTLTDGTVPSPELVFTVRKLYDSKLKDVEVLIPVLPFLSKDEVLPIFPQLVDLPLDKFQSALAQLLQGSSHSSPALTPAEVLIAIHGINPERDGIPLKKVTDACSACFEQRQVFTQQVLAKVLNQLVEQIPLPLLFMRTVIQAIGVFPALVDFTMEILSRLVSKQIWKYPKLWVGFLKCALQTKPQSFHVLLQLPAAQLENALNRNPALKPPLIEHANQPSIRSSLPRSTLVVLGLAQESSQTGHQTQTTQTVDTSNSGADAAAEAVQDSAVVS